MVSAVLLGWSLLFGSFDDPPKKDGGEAAPASARAEFEQAEALARYNERRARAANNAEAQWRLAVWCEHNGLQAEATAHLARVVQLDPDRDAAWKKLGFKKRNGR